MSATNKRTIQNLHYILKRLLRLDMVRLLYRHNAYIFMIFWFVSCVSLPFSDLLISSILSVSF